MVSSPRTVLAAALTSALLLSAAARADDWPQWRGPNRDAVWNETGILESFPPGVLKGSVHWKKDLRKEYGEVWCNASPLIEGDLLILVVGGKPNACVVAFDKHSGKAAWKALGDTATHSSPIAITAGGKRQLIVW